MLEIVPALLKISRSCVLPAQTNVLSFRAGEMVRGWSNMVKHGRTWHNVAAGSSCSMMDMLVLGAAAGRQITESTQQQNYNVDPDCLCLNHV
jgi:hypothetical protein